MSHTMHGKWSEPVVPHKGWVCIDDYDLGEPCQTCEMCEAMTIRFVHVMQHPDYAVPLEVGCVCAGHMADDYVGARRREAALKKAASHRDRWLKRTWLSSRSGNPYVNVSGYNVVIYQRGLLWSCRVEDRFSGLKTFGDSFQTMDEAKLAGLDLLQKMQQAATQGSPIAQPRWAACSNNIPRRTKRD